jgi:hypothetical protein
MTTLSTLTGTVEAVNLSKQDATLAAMATISVAALGFTVFAMARAWSTVLAMAHVCRRYRKAPMIGDDVFAFLHALRDPAVRQRMAAKGHTRGMLVHVGGTRPERGDLRPQFRVWRDRTVPGGWDGEPIEIEGGD